MYRETLQNVGSADFRVAIPAALSPVAVDFLQCLLCGLQTVLDKMALRRTSSINQHDLPAEAADAPATRTTTTASVRQVVPVMTFTVEYHSILGRQRSPVSEFTCSRTSFGLELHGPDGTEPHIEYHLADGRIRGSAGAGTCFDVDFSSLPLADVSAAAVSTWIRLAQWCVAQFPVRDARIAVPDDTLEAMQRSEQLEASLRHHATPSKPTTRSTTSTAATAVAVELAGVGVAESLEDGTLCLYFMDGAVLQVDDCASTVSYLPVGASTFDVFPLQSKSSDVTKTCDMPHQVSTRLKYVSLFIQEMKRQTQQQQRDYTCSSGP
ncbi:hypothetical protein DYB28_010984 [Aphanomyces astaci]|uniref:Uncharacterized protein n=1 Tax=Aphanomyces astaci TaxID=112090 RepID=A0A9X8H9I4_APHAT|nr:hypothetical protein DYB28_010984 [Aphanomyces astaci]